MSAEEVTEISLSSKNLQSIPQDLVQKYALSLLKLDLTDNLVSSWKGLESFSKLRTLILDKNSIKLLTDFPVLKTVDTLWLNNNQISELKPLLDIIEKSFPNLIYLSMLKNPACPNIYFSDGEAEAYQRYRYYVIYRLKNLKLLDATPIDAAEHKEAARVGKFMQVESSQGNNSSGEAGATSKAPGLKPNIPSKPPKAASFLGKGKPRYDGSNSEGNRFICNDDL